MMRLALDPFRLVLISLAGWFKQQQQAVIEYLQEENRVLREQLGGKRLRFNDAQRRRLAVRAKKLGWRMLHELTTIVTPATPQYLILDRDGKFNGEVATMLEYIGSELIRTAYRNPWQNGVAERWVGSCRRELLDHVIVLNESHLRRLLRDYLKYYHDDRIHDALKKETPTPRVVERRPSGTAKVVGMPRVGGLHHRYQWQTTA